MMGGKGRERKREDLIPFPSGAGNSLVDNRGPKESKPAIAQLVEHLTVDSCSNQMVPGSIPGGRMLFIH